MSFSKKRIDVTLTPQDGASTMKFTGLRCQVRITASGGDTHPSLDSCAIYGLPFDTMNQACTVGKTFAAPKKGKIIIEAGDDNGMITVYKGDIQFAMVDAINMPQVCLRVTGYAGLNAQRQPVKPVTKQGAVKGIDLASQIAQQAGFSFEGNDLTTQIRNPYLWGTAISQLRDLAQAMNCSWTIDHNKDNIAFSDPSKGRQGSGNVTISPSTGLVGFPMIANPYLNLKVLFSSSVFSNILINSKITVQSELSSANGQWVVNGLHFELDSMTPRGNWFALIEAVYPDVKSAGNAS